MFLLLALAGWGCFAYVVRSNVDSDAEVRAQIERLTTDRVQLAGEVEQLRTALQRQQEVEREMTEMRGQLVGLRTENADLTRARDSIEAELAASRDEVASLTGQLTEANERVSRTGAIARRTARSGRRR
jgi:chromosome segregation ATPase